jgi:hypothetical protein
MDRTDLDALTALADRRAAAADAAAADLRRLGEDFAGFAAGFVAFRHVAEQLAAIGEADREAATIFRRLSLAARRPDPVQPDPEPVRPADDDDWRAWTEDTFARVVRQSKRDVPGRGATPQRRPPGDDRPAAAVGELGSAAAAGRSSLRGMPPSMRRDSNRVSRGHGGRACGAR